MTSKRILRPEQSLLLRVADYFAQGHFCQGEFNRVEPNGKIRRCPLSAIDMLGNDNRERRAARIRLAEHLAEVEPACRHVYTNGQIDPDETIVEWADQYGLTCDQAAIMARWAATGVLPENHTSTAIAVPSP